MFCPSCGTESTAGLKYCKQCGGNLGDTPQLVIQEAGSSSSRLTGVAWALGLASVAITLGGIGIVFSHAWELVSPQFQGPRASDTTMVAMTMIIFGSATIFGIMALLIRLFTRVIGAHLDSPQLAKVIKPVAGVSAHAQMPAMPAPASSVTEHTTRNFGRHVYDESNRRT